MQTTKNFSAAYKINLLLAKLYIKQERISDLKIPITALEKFVQGKEVADYNSSLSWVKSKLAALENNYKSAYNFYQNYANESSLSLQQKREAMVERLQVKFDINLKNSENKILKSQTELQQLSIQSKEAENLINQLIISFSFIIIAFFSYHLYRQTKLRKAHEVLALTDELTGLSNRRHIMQQANEEISRSRRLNSSLIIGIMDLDFFKKINDNYGHAVGDHVLQQFSSLIKKEIRQYDNIGRIGGEEWLVLFPDAKQKDIESIIKRMRESISNISANDDNKTLNISFSMGLTTFTETDNNIDELIIRADNALYKAKENGRNCHVYM